MSVDVYLNFNGNTREAVEYYAEVFGTEKPQIMTFGEAPQHPDYQLPVEAKDLVMHARITVDGSNIMFSDCYPGTEYIQGNNVNLALVTKDRDLIITAFNKLKEGGTVTMELQETFWSPLYGQVRDKFGVEWLFSYEAGETSAK